ncbi:MAG TPA: hypothetical protein PKC49_08160, partial [Phycisphaerae bacterium]|nr:hypothetical protein [Phycisphaerae bacterium]
VKLRNVRIYHALRLILSEAGGPDVTLGFRIDAETLTISTADQVDNEMVLKTYDVSDLLFRVRRFTGPTIDPTAGGEGQQAGVLTRQGGDGVETPPAGDETGGIDGLIRLITNVVEPDSWTIHGGRGTIEAFGSQIVVWNTVVVHQRLGGPVAGVHVDVAR